MALAPPPNGAGIIPPPNPQHPPTDNEIGSAERYHQEVPPWLVHFIGNMDQMRGDINQIRGTLERVDARLENARIARSNDMALKRNTGVTVYRAKQKEVAGDGTALANALLTAGIGPLAPLPAAPPIGASISPTINTYGLTDLMILQIVQFYNYNPGIEQGDTVATRSQKIANWLTMDL